MCTEIFFGLLKRVQQYIARVTNIKALLLMNSCTTHGTENRLSALPNVTVCSLPSNLMSIMHPMNGGIISALKVRYRKFEVEHALDNIDMNANDIYKVDFLTAIHWLKRAWKELPEDVIKNCSSHKNLILELWKLV